jgi:predicted phosphodiesterase
MIYVITDTHGSDLSHLELTGKDTLIHLGDWCGSPLPAGCRNVLVQGNHDYGYLKSEFDLVVDGFLLNHVWFTHEPAFTLPLGAHHNVHGHLHTHDYEDYGYVKKSFHRRVFPNKLYLLDEIA